MKTPIFLLLLGVLSGSAQETNGITRRILDRDTDKDGKPDSRLESVFRGKQRVMLTGWGLSG